MRLNTHTDTHTSFLTGNPFSWSLHLRRKEEVLGFPFLQQALAVEDDAPAELEEGRPVTLDPPVGQGAALHDPPPPDQHFGDGQVPFGVGEDFTRGGRFACSQRSISAIG